jgi:hypothetical protein
LNVNKSLRIIWKDPVWSKVIAGGLTFVIASSTTWLYGLWEISSVATSIQNVLFYRLDVPVWLAALIVPALISVVPVFNVLIKREKKPEFSNYTRDIILGITWTWSWSPANWEGSYAMENIRARCPECKSTLQITDYSELRVNCPNDGCDWEWSERGNGQDKLANVAALNHKVWSVVDRKVHTGEYRKA